MATLAVPAALAWATPACLHAATPVKHGHIVAAPTDSAPTDSAPAAPAATIPAMPAPTPAASIAAATPATATPDAATQAVPPATPTTIAPTAAAAPVPRTIIALWDSKAEIRWQGALSHQMAEMPLNYLGLVVEPHDIRQPLPDLDRRTDVRGILTWFPGNQMPDPVGYLAWAEKAMDRGLRYVVLGDLGVGLNDAGVETSRSAVNDFLAKLGFQADQGFDGYPFKASIVSQDPHLVGFERPVPRVLPPFDVLRHRDPAAQVALVLHSDEIKADADIVTVTPHGGYIQSNYAIYYDEGTQQRQWLVNPFEFFRLAYATADLPKPDVTTLDGRRIYYSQIDGDGWRNLSTAALPGQRAGTVRSIDVLIQRTIGPYPDLPVSVAPIAGDLDPNWCGDKEAQRAARAVFALPQVEMSSHTYSHPLSWDFFEGDQAAVRAKEAQFLPFYGPCRKSSGPSLNSLKQLFAGSRPPEIELSGADAATATGYALPRTYAKQPYDLDLEISGSAKYINQFGPPGKHVALLQWSGNSLPYAEAMKKAREAGLPAINGGDPRFDPEFPSVGFVAPVGRYDNGEWQVFSGSNENTYTDDWNDRFFGFRFLRVTLENTEHPRRLKPVDLYYHIYSGDKEASVNAVLTTLAWARNRELVPIRTSQYAEIGQGFFHTQLVPAGPNSWRVVDRGGLQTIRFDTGDGVRVNLDHSTGVMGYRVAEGSLYVALDPAEKEPVVTVTLARPEDLAQPPATAYLRDSRWPIQGLVRTPTHLSFTAEGFGRGQMNWVVPHPGRWTWSMIPQANTGTGNTGTGGNAVSGSAVADDQGNLALDFDPTDGRSATVSIDFAGSAS